MIIDRLHMQNFRAFEGTHKLVLRPAGPGRSIVLVSTEHDHSRSSVMEALKLALYGKRADLRQRSARAYHDYLRQATHPRATAYEGSAVQVDLSTLTDGQERRLEARRAWRAVGGESTRSSP